MNIPHIYRQYKDGRFEGAQSLLGVNADQPVLRQGDLYVLDGIAYEVTAQFAKDISGLFFFMYFFDPRTQIAKDLQSILDAIV